MASLLLQIIIGILVALCPWFELYLVLRAILGFVCVSIVFSGLILCTYVDTSFTKKPEPSFFSKLILGSEYQLK